MAKLTSSQQQELKDAFNLFDTDHSGRISKSELRKVLQALNITVGEKELQKLMKQMDHDGSGDIDYPEFERVMGAAFFKKHSRQELMVAFKKFDTDNNGSISVKELNDVLTRLGRHVSRADVEAMIQSIDTSGDGKVSFEEFCKLFD